jgi:hypothetical protein
MPNWCDNSLVVSHDNPEMIERVRKAFVEGRLCEEFIPIPTELKETTSPNRLNPEQLIEATGYADWYDFCVNEWGTKWDVGGSDENPPLIEGNTLRVAFQSAWAPPIELYPVLEDLGFTVRAMYYEPGCAFAGIYENGYDECFGLEGNADSVEATIPEELSDEFGIVESMREYEAYNEEE